MKPRVLFATPDPGVPRRLQPDVADVCRVNVAVSPGQTYSVLRRQPFSVVIVDAKLRRLDSVELAHALYHAPGDSGTLVAWGPSELALYAGGVEHWGAVTVRRAYQPLVGILRALLDPAAARTLEGVRYQPREDAFFVAFRSGKTYELPRTVIEVDDSSRVVGEPEIIDGGSAFEVRQQSGNRYRVPWDLVLYHQEPRYAYHKGKAGQREAEASRAERIGSRIRRERAARGWSLGDLAQRTGMQPPNLSRLESGKHVPSLDTLERVADTLGVRVADLVAA
jgi:DNA-binding Xre family transcriptional regulator